eukprot:TRINITY_DN76604_c0_g1_i1.p1 TRINITY_DN76604_c0_g1~~TRINITY_DN76604_c0_g1_i1.p1  ORF type:complete len:456 (-),score=45.57 TRINITY_DN76604_c0_g1_i1:170-1537(-)
MAVNKTLWILYLVVFVDFFQLLCVIPILPSLVSKFGGTDEEISSKVAFLVTASAAAEACGCPIVGWLSDKFGRRPMIMLALSGSAISASVFSFSKNYFEAVGARVIVGLCGGTMGVAQAYVTDLTTEDERPVVQNRMTASLSLGLMAGPAVGGILFTEYGSEASCLGAAVLSFLNLVLVAIFMPGEPTFRQQARNVELQSTEAFQNATRSEVTVEGATSSEVSCSTTEAFPNATRSEVTVESATSSEVPCSTSTRLPCNLWILFLANAAISPVLLIFEAFAVLFLTDSYFDGDKKRANIFYNFCSVASGVLVFIVSMWLYECIMRCLGFNGTVISGCILTSVGLICMGAFPASTGVEVFFLGSMLFCLGYQLVMPSFPTLIGNWSPPHSRGRAFGISNSFGNWARVLSPVLLAPLFNWSHSSVWFIGAGLSLIACVVVLHVSVRANYAPGNPLLA